MQPQSYMQFAFEAKDSLLSGASGLYQKTKLLWREDQRVRGYSLRIRINVGPAHTRKRSCCGEKSRGFAGGFAEDSRGFAVFLEDSRTKPMFIVWVSEGFE